MNNGSYVKEIGDIMDNKCEMCEYTHHHHEMIERIKDVLPDEEIMYSLADFFKIFSDSSRIKILCVLTEGEMCVCDIWQTLGLTQSAVSHQLRILKQMKLVKYRRDGKTIYYSLADAHIQSIISQGLEHIME
ncbi:MAG: ArsR/SmtB family transcription factor [Eubacterium sp.]